MSKREISITKINKTIKELNKKLSTVTDRYTVKLEDVFIFLYDNDLKEEFYHTLEIGLMKKFVEGFIEGFILGRTTQG